MKERDQPEMFAGERGGGKGDGKAWLALKHEMWRVTLTILEMLFSVILRTYLELLLRDVLIARKKERNKTELNYSVSYLYAMIPWGNSQLYLTHFVFPLFASHANHDDTLPGKRRKENREHQSIKSITHTHRRAKINRTLSRHTNHDHTFDFPHARTSSKKQ